MYLPAMTGYWNYGKPWALMPFPCRAPMCLPGLQTGMVNAFFTTPVMAYASQWFAFTPYMIEMPWAPMMGAIIVSKRAWKKVPESIAPAN